MRENSDHTRLILNVLTLAVLKTSGLSLYFLLTLLCVSIEFVLTHVQSWP